jgi:hypothetical protein
MKISRFSFHALLVSVTLLIISVTVLWRITTDAIVCDTPISWQEIDATVLTEMKELDVIWVIELFDSTDGIAISPGSSIEEERSAAMLRRFALSNNIRFVRIDVNDDSEVELSLREMFRDFASWNYYPNLGVYVLNPNTRHLSVINEELVSSESVIAEIMASKNTP